MLSSGESAKGGSKSDLKIAASTSLVLTQIFVDR